MLVLFNSSMGFHRDGFEVRTPPSQSEVTFTIDFAPFKSLIQIKLYFTLSGVAINARVSVESGVVNSIIVGINFLCELH